MTVIVKGEVTEERELLGIVDRHVGSTRHPTLEEVGLRIIAAMTEIKTIPRRNDFRTTTTTTTTTTTAASILHKDKVIITTHRLQNALHRHGKVTIAVAIKIDGRATVPVVALTTHSCLSVVRM